MIRTRTLLGAAIVTACLLSGCKDDAAAPPTTTTTVPSAAAVPTAVATTAPTAAAVAPTDSAAPAPSAPTKTYACGAKDQKPCPMQGWMKRVMAPASSSADGEKLAKALLYAGERVPPGFGGWAAMAKAGAEKAKAGDIEGAKVSCKQCHDAYKESYKATMRDRPF